MQNSLKVTFLQCYWDIGYSFLIGGDGRVYEGRGWGKQGGHTTCYNHLSYGVSFIGNFQEKNPNATMLQAYEKFQKVCICCIIWIFSILDFFRSAQWLKEKSIATLSCADIATRQARIVRDLNFPRNTSGSMPMPAASNRPSRRNANRKMGYDNWLFFSSK